MIYVVDQNYFRSAELLSISSAEPKAKFVFPDVALIEMCKGTEWWETMRRSLQTLAARPGRVLQSMSVGEALNIELKTLKSIDGYLLPRQMRDFTRSVLVGIKESTSSSGISAIDSHISQAQLELQQEELNHLQNQTSLTTRTAIIQKALAGEPLKKLRSGIASKADTLSSIRQIAIDLAATHLCNEGYSINKVKQFLRQKPLLLRFYYVNVRHAFEWATKGGLGTYPAEKVTNDLLDQEYVIIGSFFDKLLSKEQRVIQADADLRAILKIKD